MSNRFDEVVSLCEQGKLSEAREIFRQEVENAQFSPDTIDLVKGKAPRFTKKGKIVELGEDGKWRRKLRPAAK